MKKIRIDTMSSIIGGVLPEKTWNCAEGVVAFYASLAGAIVPASALKKGFMCQFGWAPPWL